MKDGRGKDGKLGERSWLNPIRVGVIVFAVLVVGYYFWPASGDSITEEVMPNNVGGCLEVAKALKIKAFKRAERIYKRNLRRREEMYPDLPTNRIEALDYYTPVYPCMSEERFGQWMDGGKWICAADRFDKSTVVYSIGSNGDCSFERDLFEVCNGCQIHVFDMTLTGSKKTKVLAAEDEGILKFHDYGVSMVANVTARTKSLKTIMRKLKHSYIDVFKIDCEGCEWDLFEDILEGSSKVLWGQVQVELHYFYDMALLNPFMTRMEEHGYRLFHVEQNWRWLPGIEFSFIHKTAIKP